MKHIIFTILIATLAMSSFFKTTHIDRATKLKLEDARLCSVYWAKSNRYIEANRTDIYAQRALMDYQIKINKYCS